MRYLKRSLFSDVCYRKDRVELTEDLSKLDEIAPVGSFLGTRYPERLMQSNNLKTEEEVIKEYTRKGPK